MRKQILEHFPTDTPERYVEVFGGAGWLLFASDKHAPLEVFNDIDGQLINLYRCIRHHCRELQRELRLNDTSVLNSREIFLDYHQQLDCRGLTDIQRAARYYYIIRASFGAGRREFGCNKAVLENPIDYLPQIQQRLRDVVIENRDFEQLIKTYDRTGALFYLDPPYYEAEKEYAGFTREDHQRLHDCIAKIKGKFLLSYNDHPDIRELYAGYSIDELSRNNCLASKKGSGHRYRELLVRNF